MGDSAVDIGKASPPVGRAFTAAQRRGERGFGKDAWSRPPEQPCSDCPHKGNQASGTKGFSSNERFKP
jgi:hypothetical protein